MWPTFGITCFLIMCRSVCDAYSDGAPTEACDTMEPLHSSDPETGETPFHFTAHYQLDNQTPVVNVTIAGGEKAFIKGFLIQARDGNGELIGEFSDSGRYLKFVECSDRFVRSSLTQSKAIPRRQVNVIWRPPTGFTGLVVLRATVVQHEETFFMGHEVRVVIPSDSTKSDNTISGMADDEWRKMNYEESNGEGRFDQTEL